MSDRQPMSKAVSSTHRDASLPCPASRTFVPRPPSALQLATLAGALALALAGCTTGAQHHDQAGHTQHTQHAHASAHAGHEHTSIHTQGRLALAEHDVAALHVFDLDQHAIEARHALSAPVSELQASPGRRYAMAVLRGQDAVSFVDGGIWQEDHGDHPHDYRRGSKLLDWKLRGVAPTHINEMGNGTTAIFMDGNAETFPQVNAVVEVLSDESIGAGKAASRVVLSTPMHGMAQPLGDVLLTPVRSNPATAEDVMPDHLQLLTRNGEGWTSPTTLETPCGVLHGGGSTGHYTLAGCDYGGVLVRREGASVSTQKIPMEYRVSSVYTHRAWPGHFIGTSNRGTPPTTRFTAIDAGTAKAVTVKPEGWKDGHVRRALTLDHSGQLVVLDDEGTLYTLKNDHGTWKTIKRTTGMIAQMPKEAPFPALTSSGVDDVVYLTDPKVKQVLTVGSQSHAVMHRDVLEFVPSGVAWMGIEK